jgi:hypothetical protein
MESDWNMQRNYIHCVTGPAIKAQAKPSMMTDASYPCALVEALLVKI